MGIVDQIFGNIRAFEAGIIPWDALSNGIYNDLSNAGYASKHASIMQSVLVYTQGTIDDVALANTIRNELSTPPKCTLDKLTVATAAKRGDLLLQGGIIKNIGGTTGTFRVDLYIGSSRVAKSDSVSLAPGATANPRAFYTVPTTAPASITFTMKCVNVTTGSVDVSKSFVTAIAPPPRVCTEGAKRSPTTCWDDSVIHYEVCRNNAWALTGEVCPTKPTPPKCTLDKLTVATAAKRGDLLLQGGIIRNIGGTTGTFRVDLYIGSSRVAKSDSVSLAPGATANPRAFYTVPTTAPASITFTMKCVNVTTGSVDVSKSFVTAIAPPPRVCTEGAKRSPTTCWDDSVIHYEVCRNNAWALTGEVCPTKPECTEGDKKAGHICEGGKWQTAPVAPIPEPAPPVEPVPPVMPPADEMFTIEFQELIPGVKPPRVPLLVPGLETLPLLPGWIVRDAAGNVVNKGAELPTLQEIEKQ